MYAAIPPSDPFDAPPLSTAEFDFARFYRETRSSILSTAYRMLLDWQAAEDVVQDAYLGLHQRIAQPGGVGNPRAYVVVWVYYRCLRRLGPRGSSERPTEERRLVALADLDRLRSTGSDDEQIFESLLGDEASWNGLVHWGRQIFKAATRNVSPQQRARIIALLEAGSRAEALETLRCAGDVWAKSAVSMTLARYSERVDAEMGRLFDAGPRSSEEASHWPVFEELRRRCPSLQPAVGSCQNTLSWFIRGLNGLDQKKRRELVAAILRKAN